jgi:predicted DNA-binding transcriptional regulator AlpA
VTRHVIPPPPIAEVRPGEALPLPHARGLSRVQAAGYVGVSPSLFDQMVADGRMPRPKRINARTVWDRVQLDAAFAALPPDKDGDRDDPWSRFAV